MKRCPTCGETKSLDEFGARSGRLAHLRRSDCRSCGNRKAAEWRRRNPDVVKANNHHGSFRRRSVTEEWYLARLADQAGGCAICGSTSGDRLRRLYVDHDHATGQPRGLLCRPCNSAIGLLRDDPRLASAAAAYLVGHTPEPT